MLALMTFTLTSEQKGKGTPTTIRSSQQEAIEKTFLQKFWVEYNHSFCGVHGLKHIL
jgi:hypothetical protein